MKIEAGDKFISNSGMPIEIYAVGRGGDYPIHGAVYYEATELWFPTRWNTSGQCYDDENERTFEQIHGIRVDSQPFEVYIWKYKDGTFDFKAYQNQKELEKNYVADSGCAVKFKEEMK